jgi:hypothetical protein
MIDDNEYPVGSESSYNSFKLLTGVALLVLMSLCIVSLTTLNDVMTTQKALKQEIIYNHEYIDALEIEKIELEARIQELEKYNEISKKEFLQIWKSFGNVRNNFKALGLGYHLCPDDITPDSEMNGD